VVITLRCAGLAVAMVAVLFVAGPRPANGEDSPSIDLDAWHLELGTAAAGQDDEVEPRYVFGIYPGVSAVLGLPDVVSAQGNVFVSLTDSERFSIFLGYGVERGAPADADIYTIGWGGVRQLPVVGEQWGFYGKFLRYRRWDDRNHGVHHGLSVGTESGAGYLGVTFEFGAARSERNHWMATAQIAVKIALPIGIPLSRNR